MPLREQLASKPLPRDWTVANFVTDSVGRTAIAGSSRPLSNDIDKASLLSYRDRAEAVLTTAKTARSEQYRGLPGKALALVSRKGDFDNIPAVSDSRELVFLITTRKAAQEVRKTYKREGLHVIAPWNWSPRGIRRSLKIRGFRRIVLESGLTFTNWFAGGRALNELALSVTGLADTFVEESADAFLRKLPAASFKLMKVDQHGDTALTNWIVSSRNR